MGMSSGKKTSRRKGRANRRNGLSLEEYVEYQKSYWFWWDFFTAIETIPIICLVPLVLEMFVPPSNKVIEYWPFIAALVKSFFLLKLMWIVYCSRNRYGEYSGNFDKRVRQELLTSGFKEPLPLRQYVYCGMYIIEYLLQTMCFVHFLSFDNMVHRFTFWKLIDALAIYLCGQSIFLTFTATMVYEGFIYQTREHELANRR